MAYAQATLATAEQLLKLNLDAARITLEQNGTAARELLAIDDPKRLLEMRSWLAQSRMQRAAAYAQNVYEIVSQSQAQLSTLAQEQLSRVQKDALERAGQSGSDASGTDAAMSAFKSSRAASAAMMDSLNLAAQQFGELSEASIKAATAAMVKSAEK